MKTLGVELRDADPSAQNLEAAAERRVSLLRGASV